MNDSGEKKEIMNNETENKVVDIKCKRHANVVEMPTRVPSKSVERSAQNDQPNTAEMTCRDGVCLLSWKPRKPAA